MALKSLPSILGHDGQVQELLKWIELQTLPHSLIFSGPSGIGKLKTARALAKVLSCESVNGCGSCGPCLRAEKNQSEGFLEIASPKTGPLKLEDVSPIKDYLSLRKMTQNRSILIENAGALNPQASNSLLKVIEEPPENTFFFLIASNAQEILPTLRSRSQIVRFFPLSEEILKKIRPSHDWMIKSSQGRLDILDQFQSEESQSLRQTAHAILKAIGSPRRYEAFKMIKEVSESREATSAVVQYFQQMLRDGFLLKNNLGTPIHSDLDLSSLTSKNNDQLTELQQKSFELERDISQNIDRCLALENFWIKAATT